MALIDLIEQLNQSGDIVLVWRDGEFYLEPADTAGSNEPDRR